MSAFDKLEKHISKSNISISSIIGRYYTMDKIKDGTIQRAYNLLTKAEGNKNRRQPHLKSYDKEITDEFFEPVEIKNTEGIIKIMML